LLAENLNHGDDFNLITFSFLILKLIGIGRIATLLIILKIKLISNSMINKVNNIKLNLNVFKNFFLNKNDNKQIIKPDNKKNPYR